MGGQEGNEEIGRRMCGAGEADAAWRARLVNRGRVLRVQVGVLVRCYVGLTSCS